jgi:hypothetical protein
MPNSITVAVGAGIGFIIVAVVLWAAIRPELTGKRRRSWLAKPSGDDPNRTIGYYGDSSGGSGHGDGGGHHG